MACRRSIPPTACQCVWNQNSSRPRQDEEDYSIVCLKVRSYINLGKPSKALSNKRTSSKRPTPSPQARILSLSAQRPLPSTSTRRKVTLQFISGFIILRIGKEELSQDTIKNDIIFVEVTKNILEHMYGINN